ncbi:MAG: universal stress protein, partial [Planctomycetota bacterium]
MTISSIVVGISGNERESTKIAIAVEYARAFDARLTFLHVNDPQAGSLSIASIEQGLRFSPEVLERYVRQRMADPLPAETSFRVRDGEWIDQLTDCTRDHELLILGHQHLNWLQAAVADAQDEIVVNRADCPVLVVPDKLE